MQNKNIKTKKSTNTDYSEILSKISNLMENRNVWNIWVWISGDDIVRIESTPPTEPNDITGLYVIKNSAFFLTDLKNLLVKESTRSTVLSYIEQQNNK
jgi:hypothetical protein